MTNPGSPDAAQVLTTWTGSPVADVLIAAAVIVYLSAARRYRRKQRSRWPTGRILCWLVAAALAVASVNSALAVYGRNLLWVHMIVHLIMITVIPALVVWAQPIRLWYEAGGTGTRRRLARFGKHRAVRWLMMPWFTVPLYAVVLVGTHLTGFPALIPHHMWLHDVELGVYLASGYLLLLPIIGAELVVVSVAPILRFVVLALCMGPDALVGVVLMLTRTAAVPVNSPGRDWVPRALADQSLAGAIMWWGGDGLMMILMLVVAAQWVATASARTGSLGPWLDSVRQQTLLGTDADVDVDDDDAALQAYNARLAALHGLPPPRDGPGHRAN